MPPAPTSVAIIGRANIDLTVRVPYRPTPGQTAFGSELVTTAGGKSLNQAIAIARLGGRASLVANAGADLWGRHLQTTLIEAGVDVTHFRLLPGVPTGAAIVEVTPDGENVIVLAISPRTELTAPQIETVLASIDAPVLVVQLDLSPELLVTVLTESRRRAIRVGNLVPHAALNRGHMRHLDVFVVNQQEAAEVLGVSTVSDALAAAHQLRGLGPTAVVVTAGAHGAAYSDGDRSGTIPAPNVPVVDTTGAGDAFLGALVLTLAEGASLPDAIGRAVQIGTVAVQHPGAHLSAPGRREVTGGPSQS